MTRAAEQLVDGHIDYGITFANYSWFVEQWFAEADELLVDSENGRASTPTTSNLDGEFGQALFEWWTDIENRGWYLNPGIEARGAAKNAFHEGKAAMLVGGASLWVGEGLPSDVHDAVAEFLTWLTEPEQQKRWHRETGYFPVHEDAIPQLRSEGWFAENPQYETAFTQLTATEDTTATRGAQIGPFDTVRSIIEEGVESIDGVEEVPAALDRIDGKVESTLESYSSRSESARDRPGRQPSSRPISELSSRPTTVSPPISGFSLRTLPGPVVTFIMIHYIVYQHGGMGRKLSAKRRLDKPCQTRT